MSELIGKAIGQYQIVEQIGSGGMATIFKAFQPSIDRYVAVKILPSQLAEDENFVKRFAHEAKAIAALEHPHILPVHDFGTEGKLNYMVMRYVQGGTLTNIMGKSIPHDRIVQIVGNVARALDYAHEQGVIHRDIKPSNILIDQHGEVLLTDFGIAKMVEGSSSTQLTAAGSILGTPAYMSPEQAQGQKIDRRSDIYSLGVVLYELLTGRPPYEAETPFAIVLKHINDPLPLPRSIKPDIPEPFERVVLKAMAKDPNQRFETAGQMERSLQNALKEVEGLMVVSDPPTIKAESMEATQLQPASQKPTASKSTSPLLIWGITAVVLLCLLGIGGAVVFGFLTSPGEEDIAEANLPLSNTDSDENSDIDFEELDEGILFEDDFSSNQNGWYTGEDEDELGYFEAGINDGIYRLYMNSDTDDGNFSLVELPDADVDDFILEMDVEYIEANDEFLYGVSFRSDFEDNYYLFEVDSDGFVVTLSTEDDWKQLVEYAESPAINRDGPNHIVVEAIGPSLTFFINDEEVASIEDDSLEHGAIGLTLDLFDKDSEVYIEFDNLIVYEVSQ